MLHFPLVRMNGLNKTETAVSLYCRFSLFLKDPFFQISFRKKKPLKFRRIAKTKLKLQRAKLKTKIKSSYIYLTKQKTYAPRRGIEPRSPA